MVTLIFAVISGSQSLSSVHRFSMRHYSEICLGLGIEEKEKPPSYNTFRNMLRKMDSKDLEDVFNKILEKSKCKAIHLDGKASAGSIVNANTSEQSFLITVSAYSSELKQVILRKSFDSKLSSEIEIARELIKELGNGKLVTADSAHCNIETIALLNKKHEYLAQFKGNQKKLKQKALELEKNEKAISQYYSEERNRGRFEKRLTKVYRFEDKKWAGAESIVIQERWRDGAYEKAFYLSNKVKKASERGLEIRTHWSIESMHWEKDVLMGEDQSKIKEKNISCVMSTIRSCVLNTCKQSDIKSFSSFKDMYSHDIPKLFSLL